MKSGKNLWNSLVIEQNPSESLELSKINGESTGTNGTLMENG